MKARTGLLALVPTLALALGAAAQDRGGILLTLGLSERVEATRNLALNPVSQGTTIRSDTTLNMNLSSKTRVQELAFSTSLALRAVNPAAGNTTYDVIAPGLSFSYTRRGAGSEFGLNARYRSEDITFLRPLSDFVNEDGELELPDDFDDLSGSGTRKSYNASTRLRWGQDGPLGVGLSAGVAIVDYRNASATLYDSERTWAAVDLSLKPGNGRSFSSTLRYSHYENDDPGTLARDTITLDNRLAFGRPAGEVFGTFGIADTINGTRFSLGAGLDRDLPAGNLSVAAGATRTTGGSLAFTASASASGDFPFGRLSARLRRSISENSNNNEEIRTGAGVSFSRSLTPTIDLSINANYVRSTLLSTELSTTNASIGASIGHQLTPDWDLNLGYNRRYRNDESAGTGWVSSDTVFFGISREFSTRF